MPSQNSGFSDEFDDHTKESDDVAVAEPRGSDDTRPPPPLRHSNRAAACDARDRLLAMTLDDVDH